MKTIKNKISSLSRANKVMILLSALYAILVWLTLQTTEPSALTSLVEVIGRLAFLLGVLFLTAKHPIIRIVFLAFVLADAITRLSFDRGMTIAIWISFLNTTPDELWAFIKTYKMLISLSLFAGVIVFFAPLRLVKKNIAYGTFSVGLLFALLPLVQKSLEPDENNVAVYEQYGSALGLSGALVDINSALYDISERIPVIETMAGLARALHYSFSQLSTNRKSWSNMTQDDNAPALMVLVIGESMNASHTSLYDYDKDTTPKLNSYGNRLTKIRNAYAAGTNSWNSLPYILSKSASMNDYSLSIITLAQTAGYKVHWLSNQEKLGRWNINLSTIYDQADNKIFTRDTAPKANHYDAELLPHIDKILSERKSTDKSLIILHLAGSHMIFADRYPAEFDHFKAHEYNHEQAEIIASYDNSILYTDHIVDALLKRIENQGGSLMYFADHGLTNTDSNNILVHDVREQPALNSINVPLLYFGAESLTLPVNDIHNLYYFECTFSAWSKIHSDELEEEKYCEKAMKNTTVKYYDANMTLREESIISH